MSEQHRETIYVLNMIVFLLKEIKTEIIKTRKEIELNKELRDD